MKLSHAVFSIATFAIIEGATAQHPQLLKDYEPLKLPIAAPTEVVGNGSFAGRVIQFCGSTTTFALQCTSGSTGSPAEPCSGNASSSLTISQASRYVGYATITTEGTTTVSETHSCTFSSSTNDGSCVVDVAKTWGSQHTSTQTTSMFGAHQIGSFYATITADVNNLENGTDQSLHCKADLKGAAVNAGIHWWTLAALVSTAAISGMMLVFF